MEININFNPYEVFSGDMTGTFSFISSVCEKLSNNSLCKSMGVDLLVITPSEKEELINYISSRDYTVWITFEAEESYPTIDEPPVQGFRIGVNSGTEEEHFFRSALIFEIMGFSDLSLTMKMEFYTRIINDIFKDSVMQKIEKDVISNVNREKASKPRHQYHEEIMAVIKATWEKYPNASQTGIHEALCSHYYGKVSRNSLAKWISSSGLRPPKPDKYSSFELVLPQ